MKRKYISLLLVLIILVAALLVYFYETRINSPEPKSHQSEGVLHQGSPPQFYPNGSYPPVPVVWTITLTQSFSELPVGTTLFLLDTNNSLTGMGYSAYNHFIKDLTQISPVGAAFSEGDKVGFNGQLVVSDDINGNTFNSLHATLTYLGS